jgi:4-amino-4-deoxy-L-arabinose transferase-like glycosyltransferase
MCVPSPHDPAPRPSPSPSAPGEPASASESALPRDLGRATALVLLTALCLAFASATLNWLHDNGFDVRPPSNDPATFRLETLDLLKAWRRDGWTGLFLATAAHDGVHPPLMHLCGALAGIACGGRELGVAELRYVSTAFAVLLLVGTYRLARNFLRRDDALLAVLVLASTPLIIREARVFFPQMPMAAFGVLALDALVRADRFARTGPSAAFGWWLGLSLLSKTLAPLYLAGAGLYAFFAGLVASPRRLAVCGRAALALAVAAACGATWYVRHWDRAFGWASSVVGSDGQAHWSKGLEVWSFERWIYYPRAFVLEGVGFFWCVLALIAFVVRVLHRGGSPAAAPPWRRHGVRAAVCAAALTYPVQTIGQTAAQAHYLLSFAPIAAWGVVALVRRAGGGAAIRRAATLLILAIAAFNAYRGFRPMDRDVDEWWCGAWCLLPRVDAWIGAPRDPYRLRPTPAAEPWPNREFAEAIYARSTQPVPRVGQLNPLAHAYVNGMTLEYEGYLAGRPIASINIDKLFRIPKEARADLLRTVDYLVVDSLTATGPETPNLDPHAAEAMWRLLADVEKLPLRPIAHRVVTEVSGVTLLEVVRERPYDLFPPAAALDGPGVRRLRCEFENGFVLLGAEARTDAGGRRLLTTFWDGSAVHDWEGRISIGFRPKGQGKNAASWRARFCAPPAPGPERPYFAVTTDPTAVEGPLDYAVSLVRRDYDGEHDPSPIKKIEINDRRDASGKPGAAAVVLRFF